MRQGPLAELIRHRLEQRGECRGTLCYAGASDSSREATKSAAWPTLLILTASSSGIRTPERSSSSWTSATRSSESASRSSLKRVSSWIRDGSTSSSSARWLRMSSSTSFLVIRLSDASSGDGPQNACLLEASSGLLDRLLVDRALRHADRIGDSLGARL